MIKRIVRWIKINLLGYHDVRHITKDGTKYVVLPNGMRLRVHTKAEIKSRKRNDSLLEWARTNTRPGAGRIAKN